jgi:hypothetical protein
MNTNLYKPTIYFILKETNNFVWKYRFRLIQLLGMQGYFYHSERPKGFSELILEKNIDKLFVSIKAYPVCLNTD